MIKELKFENLSFSSSHWSCGFSGSLKTGQWYVACGPSGGGKSTFLNLLTGVLTPSHGSIESGNDSLIHLPPGKRRLSLMTQMNSLFPGISIVDNLMLALHESKASKFEKYQMILNMMRKMGLEPDLLKRGPNQVSGGQLSRCNLVRALLKPCDFLLLDEPFAAVDRSTRLGILHWLKEWQKETGIGIVLISHDLDDIFTVATDLMVVGDGQIVESATLEDAIRYPKHMLTAKTLRSGVIVKENNGHKFLGSEALHPTLKSLNVDGEFAQSIKLKAPSITRFGHYMRIVDLHDGTDVTISQDDSFDGRLWFDKRKLRDFTLN